MLTDTALCNLICAQSGTRSALRGSCWLNFFNAVIYTKKNNLQQKGECMSSSCEQITVEIFVQQLRCKVVVRLSHPWSWRASCGD